MIKLSKKRALQLEIIFFVGIILLGSITYGYFTSASERYVEQTADLSLGTMSLRFSDNDDGINEQIMVGRPITKKFKLENLGTVPIQMRAKLNMILRSLLQLKTI